MMMLVAHANGFFYRNGKFVPKEVVLASTKNLWRGFVVKTEDLLFSEKDLKSNLYVSKFISGIPFPSTTPGENAVNIEEVPEKLKNILATYFPNINKIYVKGNGMQTFFSEMLPDLEIINMDAKWPNVNMLDITKHPSHSLHATPGHCAKDIAVAYSKCMQEEEKDEYWWD